MSCVAPIIFSFHFVGEIAVDYTTSTSGYCVLLSITPGLRPSGYGPAKSTDTLFQGFFGISVILSGSCL